MRRYAMLLVVTICLVSMAALGFSQAVENNYYRAENLTDAGALLKNLTAGATTAYAAGKLNNAFLFDGAVSSSPYRTTTAADDFGTGQFSISLWFYSSTVSNGLIASEYASSHGWQLYIDGTSHKWQWYGENVLRMTGGSTIDNSTFNFIMIQREGDGKLHMYVNNVEDAAAVTNSDNYNTHPNLCFGSDCATTQRLPSGAKIDDVRIFNTSLNSTERTILWNGGLGYNYSLNYTAPTSQLYVNITAPANTTVIGNYTDKLFLLNYTITGNSSSYSCNETIDSVLYNTSTPSNNTARSYYINVNTTGAHILNISCNASGSINGSSAANFSAAFTSNITIASSAGFSITTGTPTTLSCTANGNRTLQLYRDGVLISQNYSFIPAAGAYVISCSFNSTDAPYWSPNSTSHTLIAAGGQYGCYNTTTYAFEKNFSGVTTYPVNLNFSSIIPTNRIRGDLQDVRVTPAGSFNITINNSLIIVTNNTNISSFVVDFGNYPLSGNYVNGSAAAITLNMSNYSEIGNSWYSVTLYNERSTNTTILPSGANTSISVMCINGSSDFRVTNSSFVVASFSNVTQIRAFVVYSSSDMYYRDRLTTGSVEDVYIYLADATLYNIVQTTFKIDDRTGSFGPTNRAVIRIKKVLDGSLKVVTELPIDVESKSITYLINGDKYQFYLDNNIESRAIGDIYADSSSLTKIVTVMPVSTSNISDNNVSFTPPSMTSGVISFVWADQGGNTNLVELWIYNKSNGNLITYMSSTNRSYVNFVYNTGDPLGNYTYSWKVSNDVYGNHTIAMSGVIFGSFVIPLLNPFMILITYLGGGAEWFALLFLYPLGMWLPRRYVGISALLIVGVVALFKFFSYMTVDWRVIGICLFIAVAIEAAEVKKRR